ncbi:MAG: SH3 domain-containing protein [Candidatus Aminicenantes bacterium]|nr:SH3 domain-containing protein [Candidatus Aminicenantes bacterium]
MREQKLFPWMVATITLALFSHFAGAANLEAAEIKLRVAAEQANVREKPDIMSPILKQLPAGAILEAERKEGEWFAVLVEKDEGGTVIGYVHESLVAVVATQPAKPPREEPIKEPRPPVERPPQEPAKPIKEEPRYVPPPVRPASAGADEDVRLAVTLWLGGRYAAIGDLNDGSKGLARYYETRVAAGGEGDIKALHLGSLFGAEIRLPLVFGFYLSLGAEYGSGETAGSVLFVKGSQELTLETKPRFRTIPISLSLIYYPIPVLYLKAGIDYTFARCGYSYRLTEVDSGPMTESWQEWTGEAGSSGFGVLAGLGFDWDLASGVSLTAEALYRHIRLADLGGEDVFTESSATESIEEGKLYYIQVDTGASEVVPLVFVRERRPTEAGVVSARKAELDLSGFSLKLGIKVLF